MPDRQPTLLLRCLLCALVLSAWPVQAQLGSQYRVELLVFSTPAGGAAEQWEATPQLAYPRATQFLMSADALASATPPSPANPLPPPQPSAAFVLLPASQHELGASAMALQRSDRYHILFHEAWTQPIPGQGAAVPIVLDRSGDGGAWPALQGTIKLYQSGSFFLDTNLWLNTSGDYLPGTWRMPPPPRAPASHASEAAAPVEPVIPGVTSSQSSALPSTARGQQADSSASDYPYRHAVLVKQTRKMRAGQLNYLDHPMLGVLVKITPLTAAEPEPEPTTPASI